MSRKTLMLALTGVVIGIAGGAFVVLHKSKQATALGDADSGYVDPATCAGCHAEIAKTYRLTGMGRSFYAPTAGNTVEDYKVHNTIYNRASDRYYTMIERSGKWYQRRHQIGFDGKETNVIEKQVEFVIGSGNHSRSYLFRNSENVLVEMPVSWYSEKGGYWAMSPGYDRPNQEDFRRTIANECFSCHNAYPQAAPGASSTTAPTAVLPAHAANFVDPKFPERIPQGVDCQRCHGPGRAHVEAAGSGKAAPEVIRKTIVNPARLDRERQLDTCMQCHLETTSRMASKVPRYDRAPFTFKPGDSLDDYFAFFDHAPGTGHDDTFEIAHAAYRLRQSQCFRATQMTCTTCHNPHSIPRGEEAAQHYVAVCKSCHASTHASEMPAKADCIGCHMPKRRTDDAVHVVMTDHFIQRNKPARDLVAPFQEADFVKLDKYAGEIVPYPIAQGSKREDARLYTGVAQIQNSTDLVQSIPQLQQDLEKTSPSRPEFYYQLAEALAKSGRNQEAIHWYEEALHRDSAFRPATDGLAVALIASQNLTRAAEVLEKAVAEGPYDTVALTDLGNVHLKQGKLDLAQQMLSRALSVNPESPEAQNLLGLAFAEKGDTAGAERSFRTAIALQPELAEAHQNLGNLLGSRGDFAQASFHFERAVAGKPQSAEIRDRYGLVLATIGAKEKAVVQLREAVRLDPKLAAAHIDLADVLLSQGHLDQAAGEYRIGLGLAPDAYEAHLALGEILARGGNLTEGRVHIQKAAQSPDPEVRQAALKALR